MSPGCTASISLVESTENELSPYHKPNEGEPMLTIRSLPDLLKYLETRKQYVDSAITQMLRLGDKDSNRSMQHEKGQRFAYGQAIEAVKALVEFHKSMSETPMSEE